MPGEVHVRIDVQQLNSGLRVAPRFLRAALADAVAEVAARIAADAARMIPVQTGRPYSESRFASRPAELDPYRTVAHVGRPLLEVEAEGRLVPDLPELDGEVVEAEDAR